MRFFKLFHAWHFDPLTAILTVLIIPLGIHALRIALRYLKRLVAYLVDGLLYLFGRYIVHSFSATISLRKYCKLQLGTQSKHLFVPSTREVKLDLDRMFVTLFMDIPGSETNECSHDQMLTIANRMRVIGDPGSGKSSLMKKVFRDACQRAIFEPKRFRLPVLVEIKTLRPPKVMSAEATDTWLYKYIISMMKATCVYSMDECFSNYCQTSGVLVLLDGLDEVAVAEYPRVLSVIRGLDKTLSRSGSKNIIILTMRTQFHEQIKEDFRESFGPALFVKPFTPTDIYTFLESWPFEKERSANISRIYRELTDKPTLREMCTNPLILSMYVAEDQSGREIVTLESRTQFYSKVTEELIVKRRLKQTGAQPAPTKLKEQRERILGAICLEHLLDPKQAANSITWANAVRITKGVIGCSPVESSSPQNGELVYADSDNCGKSLRQSCTRF
jgi:hypothetical protein